MTLLVALVLVCFISTLSTTLSRIDTASEFIRSAPSTKSYSFGLPDIIAEPFVALSDAIPGDVCSANTVRYSRIIAEENSPYRLPHSTITMDEIPCGPLNSSATDSELFTDDAMFLVPLESLRTARAAADAGASAIYFHISRLPYSNAFLNATLTATEGKASTSDSTASTTPESSPASKFFVGMERYATRECRPPNVTERALVDGRMGVRQGSTLGTFPSLSVGSFIFFGMFDAPIDLSIFVPFERSLVLPAYAPFQISFSPPIESNSALLEYVCPYYRPTPTPEPPPLNIRLCFPAAATVSRPGGQPAVNMSSLEVGDIVLDGDGSPSPIIAFSHRDTSQRSYEFLQLHFSPAHVSALTLSAGHLVLTSNGPPRPARALNVGDSLRVAGGGVVTLTSKIPVRSRGLFNPHTASGTLLVDGIAVSCYTDAMPITTGHALLTPIRAIILLHPRVQFAVPTIKPAVISLLPLIKLCSYCLSQFT